MTDTLSRALRYMERVPTANQGGRNDALNRLAYALVEAFELSEGDHQRICLEWNSRCSPPLPEPEAITTIHSAWSGARAKGTAGSKVRSSPSHAPSIAATVWPSKPKEEPTLAKPTTKRYDLSESPFDLPAPIADGTRVLIRECFRPGEHVRIVPATINEDGDEVPKDNGIVLTREEWLKKLDGKGGDPNSLIKSSTGAGIYVTINPMIQDGHRDKEVADHRHCLIEFDTGLDLAEQLTLYQQANLPCAAIIYSGGKSVHAWVKVDAKDATEYKERVQFIYTHFLEAGYPLDPKNANPSRLSRLPNCERFDKRQELLMVGVGAASFAEWMSGIQADGVGEILTVDDLRGFRFESDPNTLLGDRYLCRGGSILCVGPSGVGKSSLAMQFSVILAIGKPMWGIRPVRPLKTLFVQAENDQGDLAEMYQGVETGLSIFPGTDESRLLNKNLVFVRNTTHTGQALTVALARLIDKHHPDIVMLDPLLSFIGADISKQDVCGMFLRNWLGPIAETTGVAWWFWHHTGKPPKLNGKDQGVSSMTDLAYAGMGSSELTNWARAVMTLRPLGQGTGDFELKLAKRGKRAGAVHPDDEPTLTVYIRHARDGIYWDQVPPPYEAEERAERQPATLEPKLSKPLTIATMNLHGFLAACPEKGESLRQCFGRLMNWLVSSDSPKRIDASEGTARSAIGCMIENEKLTKFDGLYFRGPKA